MRIDVEIAEVERTLVDGFFPRCQIGDQPQAQRRTALQEIGLPYASDPAATRHLAHFLSRQSGAVASEATAARPTAVLFNGGVMRAGVLRQRLVDVLNGWFGAKHADGVRVLSGGDPEHAVARGAAYYGLARRGRGVRIRGGTRARLLHRHRNRDARGARPPSADQSPVRRTPRPRRRQ